jgi:hypothetical protein
MQKQFEKKKSGVEKLEVESRNFRRDRCSSYLEEMADFVGCAYGHFLLWSEDVGKREFSSKGTRSHKRRSYTFSSHRFYYNLTEITITTPPLTRILDRLIGGGISLYGDGV